MSSALERLKQLAAAKKAAEVKQEKTEVIQNETATVESMVHTTTEEPASTVHDQGKETASNERQSSSNENPGNAEESSGNDRVSEGHDHPLKMALAELEQALTEKLPEFRTILRDIHSKLRQDPEVVTALSEDEIAVIVSGLVHHANVEIVAPKAIKAAKKAAKTPVSASDL